MILSAEDQKVLADMTPDFAKRVKNFLTEDDAYANMDSLVLWNALTRAILSIEHGAVVVAGEKPA